MRILLDSFDPKQRVRTAVVEETKGSVHTRFRVLQSLCIGGDDRLCKDLAGQAVRDALFLGYHTEVMWPSDLCASGLIL